MGMFGSAGLAARLALAVHLSAVRRFISCRCPAAMRSFLLKTGGVTEETGPFGVHPSLRFVMNLRPSAAARCEGVYPRVPGDLPPPPSGLAHAALTGDGDVLGVMKPRGPRGPIRALLRPLFNGRIKS